MLVNKFAPFVLLIYSLIGILAYVNVFPGSAAYFRSNSIAGITFRVVSTALICVYCLLFYWLNRETMRFPWKWVAVFSGVLLVNFFAMVFTSHEYSYLYTASIYGYLHSVQVSVGAKTLITMYLSSISDFALAFCFMFMLPYAFYKKERLLWLTVPMVLFMLFECGYSLLKEMDQYKAIFTGATDIYGGYNISIGATFGDKQEFGCFLTVGFCSAIASCFAFNRFNQFWVKLIKWSFIVAAAIFFVISFFTLCKTAILANSLALICLVAAGLIFLFKHRRTAGIVVSSALGLLILAVILVLTVDQLHSSGFLASFYKLVNSLFLSRVNGGIWSRFYLVAEYFSKLDVNKFLFGLSKGGVNAYMRLATVEGQAGLHTGFVYFQACYGLVGSIVYAVLLFMVIRPILRVFKSDSALSLFLIGCFICTIVFNVSECEVLIVSGSTAIFMFNVICVVLPRGLELHAREG